jgi:hypothetical protein
LNSGIFFLHYNDKGESLPKQSVVANISNELGGRPFISYRPSATILRTSQVGFLAVTRSTPLVSDQQTMLREGWEFSIVADGAERNHGPERWRCCPPIGATFNVKAEVQRFLREAVFVERTP